MTKSARVVAIVLVIIILISQATVYGGVLSGAILNFIFLVGIGCACIFLCAWFGRTT